MNSMCSWLFPLGLFYDQSRKANKSFHSLTIGSLMSSGFYFSKKVTNLKVLGYSKFQLDAETE